MTIGQPLATHHHRSGDLDVVGYNTDVEVALIGAVLLHGPAAMEPLGDVDADDFSPANAALWTAARSIAALGYKPDPAIVADELGASGIEALGGRQSFQARYVDALSAAPVLTTAVRHAKALRQAAQARRLQAAALHIAHNPTDCDVDDLLGRLQDLQSSRRSGRVTLTAAEDVDVDRPHWIWDQRIPVGGVTLMAGREGDGKTLLVCWLAARITQGQLIGERQYRPADVVYVGLEDDRSTVIKPRLLAAGADPARFHFVDLTTDQPFALDTDMTDLGHACAHLDVGLIVFDPLDAHLGAIDSHKKGEVQAAIGRLAVLTQELRCGALGLAHFNKAGLNDLLVRINGSRGFSTAVRSVLALGPHPENETDRLCIVAKANMTSKTDVPALRFRIEGHLIANPNDGTDIATATIAVLGEEAGHHPDSLLAVSTEEDRTLADEATEWLEAILADGPLAKADIVKLARHEGYSERPLRTAQQRLKVIAERDPTRQGRPSTWRLPTTTGGTDVT